MNGNIAEKMTKIADDLVAKARQLDLLSYLQMQAPWELVPIGPNRYQTKTHDSLKIDHGKWYWWSRGIGGLIDIIVGDFIICRAPFDSDTYASLTPEQFEKYELRFRYPEKFYKTFDGIRVMRQKERPHDVLER